MCGLQWLYFISSFHAHILTERVKAMNNSVEQAVSLNVDFRRTTPWTTFPQHIHKSHSGNRRIILKWIVKKLNVKAWIVFVLIRARSGSGLLWSLKWKSRFRYLTFLNEIRSIKLIHQLAYFTTHYNMVLGKSKHHPRTGREDPEG